MARPYSGFDAIVIGAGHNGLTAGASLARAGMSVCVLERGDRLGGAGLSEIRAGGVVFSSEAYASRLVDPWIMRELDLARFGLRIVPTYASYGLTPGAPAIGVYSHPVKTERSLARLAPRAAERFRELRALVHRQQRFEAPLREAFRAEPGLAARGAGVAAAFLDLQELGAPAAYELSQFWTESLGDLLDSFLDFDLLKAMLGVRAMAGVPLGPYASATASRALHNPLLTRNASGRGVGGYIAGGAGALSQALANCLRAAKGEIRFGAAASAILLENGRAAGVVLEDGIEIRGKSVLSSLDVKRTFQTFLQADPLPQAILGRLTDAARPCVAKLDLALASLPEFPDLPADWIEAPGDICIAPDLRTLEVAVQDLTAGQVPAALPMLLCVPSLLDRRRAPPGRHVMSVLVHGVPEVLSQGGWDSEQRGAFTASVFKRLEAVSPGLVGRVTDMRLLLPPDLETDIGTAGGASFPVDEGTGLSVLNRPALGQTSFATPIPNLFLCGAGAPPGGGLTAAPGALCARAVVAHAKKGGRRW